MAACGPRPVTRDEGEVSAPAIEQRVDAASLLGKSKAEIAKQFGPARDCHREGDSDPLMQGEACGFGTATEMGKATEVFFVNDKTAHLTLPSYGLPFEPQNLRAYGIVAGKPAAEAPAVTRWTTTLAGKPVEISMFPDGAGGIGYVYLKSMTLP